MSLRYIDDILPSDESFVPPKTFTNKELEKWFNWRGSWGSSIQWKAWVEEHFFKILKDESYEPQYFDRT
jgi:hypothetical protein